jgi:hypothetical protein
LNCSKLDGPFVYDRNPFKYSYPRWNMRWFLLLVSVILLLSCVGQVQGDDGLTLRISTDKKTYEAQERGVLHLEFSNNSDDVAEDINVEIESDDILFFVKTDTIESIVWGSETLQFKFQCRNLQDGKYPITVSYSYMASSRSCQGGVCQMMKDRKSYDITIENGKPRIILMTTTLDVINNKTQITFKNAGSVAIDFQFEITSDLELQYESYIGYVLSSSSSEIVCYGNPGGYEGSVVVHYRDRFEREYEREFLVQFVIKKKISQPEYPKQHIRKIEINALPESKPSSIPLSQYFAYFIVFSCLTLIGVGIVVRLKNLGR